MENCFECNAHDRDASFIPFKNVFKVSINEAGTFVTYGVGAELDKASIQVKEGTEEKQLEKFENWLAQ